MKPPVLLCRCVQLRVALARHARATPPRWCRRHLAACPRCQLELAAEAALDDRLRRGPVPQAPPAPAGLDARILAALDRAARPVAPVWSRGWKPALAVAALVLLMAGGLVWSNRSRPAAQLTASAPAPPRPGLAVPTNLVVPDAEQLLALTTRLNDPLQQELDRVLNDLRTAGQSLAASFLPDALRP
jgi:hypothetical protein